jgi:hypothetical protein
LNIARCAKTQQTTQKEVAMSKKIVPFKAAAISTVTALALAAFAVSSAFAAGPAPTATSAQPSSAALQGDWKAESSMLHSDIAIVGRFDRLLDLDRSIGTSVRLAGLSSVSVADLNSLLGKISALVGTHDGFDTTGAVTDATKATTTVQTLGVYLDQFNGEYLPHLRDLIRIGSSGNEIRRFDRS